MSRSKTGLDRDREETPSPSERPATPGGGPGEYPRGRESWPDFPRRVASRWKARSEDERQYSDREDPSAANVAENVEDPRYRSRRRHRYHGYDDLASGRADHEDIPRYGEPRRGYYPRRDDYRSERRGYDRQSREYGAEPYEGEWDYPNRGYRAYETDYGYGGDYATGPYTGWQNAGLRCRDIMTKNVRTCDPRTLVRDVADLLEDEGVGSIPVVENGRVVGLITDRDIVCRVVAEGLDSRVVKAGDVMSEDILTCAPDEPIIEAVRKMADHQVRRVPVCDPSGRLRGIISLADIALEAQRDRYLADALARISQPTPYQSRRM